MPLFLNTMILVLLHVYKQTHTATKLLFSMYLPLLLFLLYLQNSRHHQQTLKRSNHWYHCIRRSNVHLVIYKYREHFRTSHTALSGSNCTIEELRQIVTHFNAILQFTIHWFINFYEFAIYTFALQSFRQLIVTYTIECLRNVNTNAIKSTTFFT